MGQWDLRAGQDLLRVVASTSPATESTTLELKEATGPCASAMPAKRALARNLEETILAENEEQWRGNERVRMG